MFGKLLGSGRMHENKKKLFFLCFLKGEINLKFWRFFWTFKKNFKKHFLEN
jgi:hypothetical protein